MAHILALKRSIWQAHLHSAPIGGWGAARHNGRWRGTPGPPHAGITSLSAAGDPPPPSPPQHPSLGTTTPPLPPPQQIYSNAVQTHTHSHIGEHFIRVLFMMKSLPCVCVSESNSCPTAAVTQKGQKGSAPFPADVIHCNKCINPSTSLHNLLIISTFSVKIFPTLLAS